MTFSTHFSATNTRTPANPAPQPIPKNLYLLPSSPSHLLPSPLHLVSRKQQKSKPLLPAISANSPSLPDIVPTFNEPTLNWQPRELSGFSTHMYAIVQTHNTDVYMNLYIHTYTHLYT